MEIEAIRAVKVALGTAWLDRRVKPIEVICGQGRQTQDRLGGELLFKKDLHTLIR